MTAHQRQIPAANKKVSALDKLTLILNDEIKINREFWGGRFYFQRVDDDGKFEISTPSGFVISVAPERIRSVEKRSPVTVRVQKCTANAYRGTEWITATVLSAFISSVNPSKEPDFKLQLVNGLLLPKVGRNSIHPEDWDRLISMANRDFMPVIGKYHSLNARAAFWSSLTNRARLPTKLPEGMLFQPA